MKASFVNEHVVRGVTKGGKEVSPGRAADRGAVLSNQCCWVDGTDASEAARHSLRGMKRIPGDSCATWGDA